MLPVTAGVPSATAEPCADTEVVFARGTGDPPGVGPTGQAFVDAVARVRAENRSKVYPVNYPASEQWSTGLDGIRDAGSHVVSMAGACPKTKIVLGGYSQGAAVTGFVTLRRPDWIPDEVDPATVPKPLSPEMARPRGRRRPVRDAECAGDELPGPAAVVIGPLYRRRPSRCVPRGPGLLGRDEFRRARYVRVGRERDRPGRGLRGQPRAGVQRHPSVGVDFAPPRKLTESTVTTTSSRCSSRRTRRLGSQGRRRRSRSRWSDREGA